MSWPVRQTPIRLGEHGDGGAGLVCELLDRGRSHQRVAELSGWSRGRVNTYSANVRGMDAGPLSAAERELIDWLVARRPEFDPPEFARGDAAVRAAWSHYRRRPQGHGGWLPVRRALESCLGTRRSDNAVKNYGNRGHRRNLRRLKETGQA